MFEDKLVRAATGALNLLGLAGRVSEKLWEGRVFELPYHMTKQRMDSLRVRMESVIDSQNRPLLLVCDSAGGEAPSALAFAAFIKKSEVPVVTFGKEQVNSAGVMVFAAGHRRILHPGACLGMHGGRLGANGEYFFEEGYVQFMEKNIFRGALHFDRVTHNATRIMMDHYAGQRLPDALFGRELVDVTDQQAIHLGLSDETGDPTTLEGWWQVGRRFRKS